MCSFSAVSIIEFGNVMHTLGAPESKEMGWFSAHAPPGGSQRQIYPWIALAWLVSLLRFIMKQWSWAIVSMEVAVGCQSWIILWKIIWLSPELFSGQQCYSWKSKNNSYWSEGYIWESVPFICLCTLNTKWHVVFVTPFPWNLTLYGD